MSPRRQLTRVIAVASGAGGGDGGGGGRGSGTDKVTVLGLLPRRAQSRPGDGLHFDRATACRQDRRLPREDVRDA